MGRESVPVSASIRNPRVLAERGRAAPARVHEWDPGLSELLMRLVLLPAATAATTAAAIRRRHCRLGLQQEASDQTEQLS